jgi:hypothetical protein
VGHGRSGHQNGDRRHHGRLSVRGRVLGLRPGVSHPQRRPGGAQRTSSRGGRQNLDALRKSDRDPQLHHHLVVQNRPRPFRTAAGARWIARRCTNGSWRSPSAMSGWSRT